MGLCWDHPCADEYGNCMWCAEWSAESTVQVTASDELQYGVRCLMKADTITSFHGVGRSLANGRAGL